MKVDIISDQTKFNGKDQNILAVARAEGYNLEGDNAFWEDDEYKSQVRDLYCSKCGKQVVMSNKLFSKYQSSKDVNFIILCQHCL